MKSFGVLSAVGVVLAAALHSVFAAPIPVRFAEGLMHGFLVLRTVDGSEIAQGDLLQVRRNGEIDKRMVFHFKDGSIFDEKVTYTQDRVYALKSYALSKTGPAFEADTAISLTPATGAYRVKTKDHKNGDEKIDEGKLQMPADVYNGMILTVVKDLAKGAGETVHYVAFTPAPRMIELELVPLGEQAITIGELPKTAIHFALKPRLGMWLRLFATLTGRAPEDSHAWILNDEIPAFVGFEGSLTTPGPVWRIELTSPRRRG
jgi:hypothetical protein